MTSAEFLAKYRVLKTLTEQGARTQIAQEVALGRMVMIHHLDVGTSAERQRLAARVANLTGDAATKVFEVVTIDGAQVVVTHFLATFTDLPSWLDQHSAATDPSEAKTVVMQAPDKAPPPAGGFTAVFGAGAASETPVTTPRVTAPQTPPSQTPPPSKGAFTEVFGGVKPLEPPAAPVAPRASKPSKRATPRSASPPVSPPASPPVSPPAGTSSSAGDFTRVFQGTNPSGTPVSPAVPAPVAPIAPPATPALTPPPASLAPPPASFAPAPVSPPPSPAVPLATPKSPLESGFTQVFGAKPAQSADRVPPALRPAPGLPSPGQAGPPLSPNAARFDSVMPPVERVAPPRPGPVAPPTPSINSTSNEFNALFARLDPAAASAPLAPPPSMPPAPTFSPPPAGPPAAGAPTSPPNWQQPPTPATHSVSSLAGLAPGSPPPARGPSEFTRVLGRAQMPPVAPPAARLPDPGSSAPGFPTPSIPQPKAPSSPAAKSTKSYLPVIIALNVVLIGAILVVVFVVMKR